MDFDLRVFVAAHFVDILMLIVFIWKVLIFGKADLRTKFKSALLWGGVIVFSNFLRSQVVATSVEKAYLYSYAITIGTNLIMLKIIFNMIDAKE